MKQENVKKRFGLVIKNWRGKSGISQEELAWRAGLHRSYVADVERGVRNLSLESIEKLANALKVSFSTLFEPLGDFPEALWLSESTSDRNELVDILLIEDNPNDVELTLEAFRKAKIKNRVHVATDGALALAYLFGPGTSPRTKTHNRPKIILLDLDLPKISGTKLLQVIKTDKRTRTIPVIVLTASRHDRDMMESRRLGADAYIVKPVNFHSFGEATPQLSLHWGLFKPFSVVEP